MNLQYLENPRSTFVRSTENVKLAFQGNHQAQVSQVRMTLMT